MPNPDPARFLRALPDALTATFFLMLWITPLGFGEHGVRNGMLVMLVEFILIHASVFLGHTAFAKNVGRRQKAVTLAGFALFYAIFIAAFSLAFGQWWPVLAFSWLLLSKFSLALSLSPTSAGMEKRMVYEWIASSVAYIGGVFLTLVVPLPMLGIRRELLPLLDLPGRGFWIENPHQLIAFGCFYFAVLAVIKWRDMPRAD